jgi:hypothetical protein
LKHLQLFQILSIKDWNRVVPRLIGEIALRINAVRERRKAAARRQLPREGAWRPENAGLERAFRFTAR